ncbi:MAG: UDP-N-acetylmuramoyl-L-alanine--D-glutamate ligase [Gallionella sp.]|nr:UDP-N-acetylmuramoyl-L-alanine--D-glutamate ligase [Gallionella sp.]
MKSWAKKHVLVLGLGESGLSMVRYLAARGARLRVADSRAAPPGLEEVVKIVPAGQVFCGPFSDALFASIELIAISPGVPLSDPYVAAARARSIPVVGDIELFAQQIQDSGCRIQDSDGAAKVIAITGSNGKTTVTSMVEHLCRALGVDAVAAGNISPAVLDVVMERGEKQPAVWVLELSSFQLETTFTLNADAATVLNISEDHLDRYAGMDDYAAAKQGILAGCGVQILNRDDARSIGMRRAGVDLVSFGLNAAARDTDFGIERENNEVWLVQGRQRLMRACELHVAGLHNVANALAALALCRAIDLPMKGLLEALLDFKGLPHRVEFVAKLNDIAYYDDSKGTNVGATVAALEGLGCPAVLIAGGEGKGQDFSPLKLAVAKNARAVVLIGRDAPLIAAALHGCDIPLTFAKDMGDAVRQAAGLAVAGDAVLLSPACASFDMYKNYVHRATVFVGEVRQLVSERGLFVESEALSPGSESSRELQMTRNAWSR